MSRARESQQERRARLQAVQEQQRRAERRRRTVITAVTVAVIAALVIPATVVIVDAQRRQAAVEAAANAPIDGVREYEVAAATHVTTDVDYAQTPPVGGEHDAVWQNCGFYDEPVVDEHAVHSLEHGAVWLTYSPTLPAADVAVLRDLAAQHSYLLVSPHDGATSVVASAWGVQLELDGVTDERLDPFLVRYLQGPQTPEPGASCSGGIGA
jgi:hypothetical protein